MDGFIRITLNDEDTNMAYDINTKVIYYAFWDEESDMSFMAPYISENGKFCRFIDNKIVEIV